MWAIWHSGSTEAPEFKAHEKPVFVEGWRDARLANSGETAVLRQATAIEPIFGGGLVEICNITWWLYVI